MNSKVDLHRFEEQVEQIEQDLRENPPKPGGVLFYGSSTMANWRENDMCYKQMSPLPLSNTGFGGSTAEEALYHYKRLVFPVKPSIMVYYEGANDLGSGYTPVEILDITHRLFECCRQDFPGMKFLIIPIKLSPGLNISLIEGKRCNDLFSQYADEHEDTSIITVDSLIYNDKGEHVMDIYVEDNLHHNVKGYEILASLVKQEVEKHYDVC